METSRFLLAIVLMIAVVFVTNLIFPPPERPLERVTPDSELVDTEPADHDRAPAVAGTGATDDATGERPSQDRRAEAEPATPEPVPVPADRSPRTDAAEPDPGAVARTDAVSVESPLYRFGFSDPGAALVSAELLRYESFTRDGPVQVVPDEAALLTPRLRIGDREHSLENLSLVLGEGEGAAGDTLVPPVVLSYHGTAAGRSISLTYSFEPGRYVVAVSGVVSPGEGATLLLDMGPTLAVNEEDAGEDFRALAYVVHSRRDGIRNVRLEKVTEPRIEEGPLTWIALKNKYFVAAVLIPEAPEPIPFGGLIARPLAGEHQADLTLTLPVQRDGAFAYRLYLGPQQAERLAALGHEFQDVNPIGYRIFRPIISPLAHLITWALVQLQGLLGLGYGWVLIVFGFLVRGLLWPLNAKAMRSQLKNMELQPVLKEVQTRYKDEPEKLQKEMLKLYKEKGFNPLGGCLPMLIPFPVLITLFFVFQNTIEFRGVEFLWLPDLSRPDPIYLLPVILGLSMFVLQWISLRSTPQTNPQMKMMLWFMPIFMVVIFLNLASGLNLYYAASNVATVPQQLFIMKERKRMHAAQATATEEGGESSGPEKPKRDESRGGSRSGTKGPRRGVKRAR